MKKNQIQNSFYIPKGERNGILVFLICSVCLIIGIQTYTALKTVPVIINMKNQHSENILTKNPLSETKKKNKYKGPKTPQKRQTFVFNPNTVSYDSLRLLGFTSFAAKNLVNYRNKGGNFKTKQQLYKIYGTDSLLIRELENSIIFSDPEKVEKSSESVSVKNNMPTYDTESQKKTVTIVEINAADSAALVSIKGIGPYFA